MSLLGFFSRGLIGSQIKIRIKIVLRKLNLEVLENREKKWNFLKSEKKLWVWMKLAKE